MEFTRRHLTAAAGATAATTFTRTALGGWEPSERYPDPAIQILDPSFAKYRLALAGVERLATGMRWSEGPVYFGDARCVLWSDIPNNRIMRWDEDTGLTSVYRKPSNNANGNTRDRQGRLVTCEHDARRVTRTEYDGAITPICDRFQGKRLTSPNDVVVKSDGSIWFTDPQFGILGYYEGHIDTPELPMNVYRVDGQTGEVTVVADDIIAPNGLAFSPDEQKLYIVESRSEPRRILVHDVVGDGRKLANRKVLIDAGPGGTPAGCRGAAEGSRWRGGGRPAALEGGRIFNPAGAPRGHIALPERCPNLCFGGGYRNRLFMAASHSLYGLYVNTQGVAG